MDARLIGSIGRIAGLIIAAGAGLAIVDRVVVSIQEWQDGKKAHADFTREMKERKEHSDLKWEEGREEREKKEGRERTDEIRKAIKKLGAKNVRCPKCGRYYSSISYAQRIGANGFLGIGFCSPCKYQSGYMEGLYPITYEYEVTLAQKLSGKHLHCIVVAANEKEAGTLALGFENRQQRGYIVKKVRKVNKEIT